MSPSEIIELLLEYGIELDERLLKERQRLLELAEKLRKEKENEKTETDKIP